MDKNGSATAKTDIAFYGVDTNNTIVFTYFDVAENKAEVDSEGNWVAPANTTTKRSLGNDYYMVKASSIGKEWFEQVDAFQQSTVGKTVEDVLSMELDNGKAVDTDVLSSCTIGLIEFLNSLTSASQYIKAIQ